MIVIPSQQGPLSVTSPSDIHDGTPEHRGRANVTEYGTREFFLTQVLLKNKSFRYSSSADDFPRL